jgi:Peptidase family M23/Putative serine esterase (DUF676)
MLEVNPSIARPRRAAPRRRRRRRPLWPHIATGRRPRAGAHSAGRPIAWWRPVVALAMAAGTAAGVLVGAPEPAEGRTRQPAPPGETIAHVPPVDAPIADPFRPPAGPYGAGNRGLEYATSPGDVVRASAPGTVVFAGPVAGSLHVTLLHADGVRTSYSFLLAVGTTVGATVAGGDPIGTAGSRLHFGARVGDAYFDPSALFTAAVTVELLPFEVPPGSVPDAEARALQGLALDGGGGLPLGDVGASWRWLRAGAVNGATVVVGGAGLAGARTAGRGLSLASDMVDRLAFPGPCSSGPPPARPVAGQLRVAITVAGLGSTSGSAAVDDLRTSDLGYDDGRVVRFSYAGGHTPGSASALPGVPASGYTSGDTQGDAVAAAARLADLVEQVAAADPHARVDVYAHSLGGLVTRLALHELEVRGFDLTRLGLVATLASPHEGADLATAVAATADAPRAGPALATAARALGLGLDPDAPVVEQLSERSALVAGLASAGVPRGVRFVSIAARGDLVVASPHTDVDGADQITVPVAGLGAHSSVVGSDAATAELARALAGQPPGCEAWHDVVADVLTGHAISAVEDDIGLVLRAAG